MTLWLKQSTAKAVSFGPFVDKTDGVTPETGLVSALDHASTGILLSKNGGALTIRHATVTASSYDAYGNYIVTLDTTDTNTLGTLRMQFIETATCLPVWQDFMVVPANVWDSMFGADYLDVNAFQWNGTTIPAVHTAGYPIVTLKDGTGTGEVDTTSGGVLVSAHSTAAKAEINAECLDVIATDTYAEPGQATPAATLGLAAKINYLFKAWRNKSTQTSTTYKLYNDDAATVDQKATCSDDGTTFTKGEVGTGP